MPERVGRIEVKRRSNRRLEHIALALSGYQQKQVTARPDKRDARPAAHTDAPPHLHLIIVNNRVGNLVAKDGLSNIFRHLLIIKLG